VRDRRIFVVDNTNKGWKENFTSKKRGKCDCLPWEGGVKPATCKRNPSLSSLISAALLQGRELDNLAPKGKKRRF